MNMHASEHTHTHTHTHQQTCAHHACANCKPWHSCVLVFLKRDAMK